MAFTCSACGCQFTEHDRLLEHVRLRHEDSNEGTFKCDDCDERFFCDFSLERHRLERHHSKCSELDTPLSSSPQPSTSSGHRPPSKPPKFQCVHCGKSYKWHNSLLRHEKKYHSENRFICCKFCGRKLKTKDDLRRHLRRSCDILKKRLAAQTSSTQLPTSSKAGDDDVEDLRATEEESTLGSQAPKDPLILICKYCGTTFAQKWNLKRHLKLYCAVFKKRLAKQTSPTQPPTSSKGGDEDIEGDDEDIEDHRATMEESMIDTPSSSSSSSSSSSPQPSTSSGHCPPSTPPKYLCVYCGKSYKWRNNLSRHEKDSHYDIRLQSSTSSEQCVIKLKCVYCGKEFKFWKGLHHHVKTHFASELPKLEKLAPACPQLPRSPPPPPPENSGQCPPSQPPRHQCVYCGKTYSQRSGLNYHVRSSHYEIGPESCSYCGKTFKKKRHFFRHLSFFCPGLKEQTSDLRNICAPAISSERPVVLTDQPDVPVVEQQSKSQWFSQEVPVVEQQSESQWFSQEVPVVEQQSNSQWLSQNIDLDTLVNMEPWILEPVDPLTEALEVPLVEQLISIGQSLSQQEFSECCEEFDLELLQGMNLTLDMNCENLTNEEPEDQD